MNELNNIKLPDPYQYPHEYYQVRIPSPGNIPAIDPMGLSEWAYVTDKTATYKKCNYVEVNGMRTKRWLLISYQ